jgi:hypothetical protein
VDHTQSYGNACLQRAERLKEEKRRESIDSEALGKLSYVPWPLVVAGVLTNYS